MAAILPNNVLTNNDIGKTFFNLKSNTYTKYNYSKLMKRFPN